MKDEFKVGVIQRALEDASLLAMTRLASEGPWFDLGWHRRLACAGCTKDDCVKYEFKFGVIQRALEDASILAMTRLASEGPGF